tara:strand:- start:37 stop:267 length:231 start_codon:yes stop_codon:yes gene_type:complete
MDLNYTIRSGDTLIKLADKFKTTVDELALNNDIKDADSIQVGQRLAIQQREDVAREQALIKSADDTVREQAANKKI